MSANLACCSLQLAQGQDGSFRRFAVLEFATAEMAEEARRLNDGRLLGGTNIRVSFCAPGVPGRSMLAALIAAQTMVLLHKDEIQTWSCLVLLLLCSFLFCGYLLRLLIGEKVSSQILQSCKYLQVSIILPPSRCCLTPWYRETSKVRKIAKGVRTDAATVCSHGFFMSRPPWCSPCNPAVGQPCSFCCPAPDSSSEPSQSPTGTAVIYDILQRAPPCLCFIPSRSSAQFFFLSLCFLLTFSKPF